MPAGFVSDAEIGDGGLPQSRFHPGRGALKKQSSETNAREGRVSQLDY